MTDFAAYTSFTIQSVFWTQKLVQHGLASEMHAELGWTKVAELLNPLFKD